MRRLTTDAAAAYIAGDKLSPRTMEGWRARGVGPRYIRLPNGAVLYDVEDLDQWLVMRRVRTKDCGVDEAA